MNSFKKIILNNGIPLYLCIDPHMKSVFASYNVLYGSSGKWFNFNNSGINYKVTSGYAHYLEHLLGEHCKYGNMYSNFENRMQKANAYTANNLTSYHFKGADNIKESLKELIIAIEEPVFDEKDVNATRHAIEEESASRFDDNNIIAVSLVEKNLYGGFDKYDDTLSTIGNRETTRLITTENLYNCYNAFYTDDKKFLIIAGNLDEKKVVDYLNEIYSKIKPHKSYLTLPNIDYDRIRKPNEVINRNVDTPISSIGIKVKKPDDLSMKQLKYCMQIMHYYLIGSKFHNDLSKNGLYDSIYYRYLTNTENYIDFIQSFTAKDNVAYCQAILEKLNKKDITQEDYELIRKGLIANEIRKMDDKYNHIESFPERVYYTDEYSNIDFYRRVGYDEFMSMYQLLDFNNHTIGEVKRLAKK